MIIDSKTKLKMKEEKNKKRNIFISMPMQGMTIEEIITNFKIIKTLLRPDFINGKFLNSIITDTPPTNIKNTSIWYLAKSLEILSQADLAVFIGDWESHKGCLLEHAAATEYGINTIQMLQWWRGDEA